MRLHILGPTDSIAQAIAAHLPQERVEGQADAILIDAFDAPDAVAFDALDDAAFDRLGITPTLDRVDLFHEALPLLDRPGNIVVVGSNAYLGRWHGVAQAAASAALLGIVRSLGQELAPQGIRVNLLALPHDASADDADLIADAAGQAAALLTTRSMTGATVLLDDGANLKFRQARRR